MRRQVTRAVALLATALCGALGLTACGPPDPGTSPRTSTADGIQQSDALLERTLADDAPGCSAAVALDGEIVWAVARGLADRETGAPLTIQTRFDLASVSKQFTGIAILQLVDGGALALEDRLGDRLDGFPSWAHTISLADLLHHRSGIPDYTALLTEAGISTDEAATQQDALAAIAASEPTATPGQRFEYSNSNFVLLAEIVERTTGQRFAEYLTDHVFGSHELRLDPTASPPEIAARYAGGSTVTSAWTQVGDGAVVASPSALAAWAAEAYGATRLGDRPLSEAVADDAVPIGDGSAYGAGIVVAPDGALSHLGGWAGHSTLFGVSGDRRTVIVVSCNSAEAPLGLLGEGLRRVWAS